MSLNIPVIIGSGREGNASASVARYVAAELEKHGITAPLIDVRDFATPVTVVDAENELVAKWRTIVTAADAFVIIAPEYNHSYPGELKILLDKAYEEYADKPVAVLGVSAGGIGGTRVVEHIAPLLTAFKMMPLRTDTYFTGVQGLFEEGATDTTPVMKEEHRERYEEKMKKLAEELIRVGTALAAARN